MQFDPFAQVDMLLTNQVHIDDVLTIIHSMTPGELELTFTVLIVDEWKRLGKPLS